jgi:hypothetical protein
MESKTPERELEEAERPTGRPVGGGMRFRSPELAMGRGSEAGCTVASWIWCSGMTSGSEARRLGAGGGRCGCSG